MLSEHSPELAELASALSAAQAEFTAVPRDSENKFFKSSYASLASVVGAAAAILSKHGLAVSQFPGLDDSGQDTLVTWLMHESGQFIAHSMKLHLAKADAQGQGSAMTYARRYAYMAALGLVADDDDDGDAASRQTTNGGARVTARPAQSTERIASAKQRGLINGKAGEKNLPPITVADIVLAATENEARDWESQSEAEAWLTRAMDRLPAKHVDAVLTGIERADPEELAL